MSRDDFPRFYSTTFPRVSAAVWAFCGDAEVAHEATQEAFARAFARWPRLQAMARPEAWVTTAALNVCRREFRGRARKRPVDSEASAPGPSGDRPDLLSALRLLPERQLQAVVLYYLMDCSVGTVADLMGLSDGAVKAHLHKARAALRNALKVRHA